MAGKGPLDSNIAHFIFVGTVSRTFEILGQEVEFHSLETGDLDSIRAACSGLDLMAKDIRLGRLYVSYAICRVGNYTFPSLDEKKDFVSRLKEPVLQLFVNHYMQMLEEQRRTVAEEVELIKKSQSNQSPEESGQSSSNSQGT